MNTDLGKNVSLGVCFGLVALLCAGCGPATGTVTGTVTYKNKPLTSGSVTFVTPNGTASGVIDNSGTYKAENVPVGDAKVSVYSSAGPKMTVPFGGAAKDKMSAPKDAPAEAQNMLKGAKGGTGGVNIPQKYSDVETSGLSVTVKSGPNPYNIDLKD